MQSQERFGTLRVRGVYRYSRHYRLSESTIDGLPNFYAETFSPGLTAARLERGINRLRPVRQGAGLIRPAILIGSSPHKAGSVATPWHDYFDIDRGHVRYFGDNRWSSGQSPQRAEGNAALLEQFELHTSGESSARAAGAPVLLFRRVPFGARLKGQVEFDGVALIERAQLVTQIDPTSGKTYPNYRFDLVVLSLTEEDDAISWAWIDARRRPAADPLGSLKLAPKSWRRWVSGGASVLENVRRRVVGQPIVSKAAQLPGPRTDAWTVLEQIYAHYKRASGGVGEHAFEAVAELIAEALLAGTGAYRRGWITRRSGDFGVDFVGRLDVGSGFGTAKLVVLGQAKCERPTVATSAQDLARTVARLRRGWIGVYVTTSYFSEATQRESAEDAYPLVLVNGLQVAEVVRRLALERGFTEVGAFLTSVDLEYPSRLSSRSAEEILIED